MNKRKLDRVEQLEKLRQLEMDVTSDAMYGKPNSADEDIIEVVKISLN